MLNIVKYTIAFLIVWFSLHTFLIVFDGLNDERVQSDVCIILGNKVNPDGSLSERLKRRLDKGLELYNDSVVHLIFVSGGLGKKDFMKEQKWLNT